MTERPVVTRPPAADPGPAADSRPAADPGPAEPFLRVTRGNPTAEELAVLVAVLLDLEPRPDDRVPERHRSRWADPAAVLRLHGLHRR
jgi:Acyl-CoA carboxylase epsilon subunit